MRGYQRFFRRDLTERHLEAGLRFHLDQRIADLVATGVSPEEARRRAQLEFGGFDQAKEECREVGSAHFLELLIQALRYSLRMLARNPGFAAVAVLTQALGIGATTAIFSVLNGVLLEPLPYPQPERLVKVSLNFPASNQFNRPADLSRTEPHLRGHRSRHERLVERLRHRASRASAIWPSVVITGITCEA
jgi:hypothetical protein